MEGGKLQDVVAYAALGLIEEAARETTDQRAAQIIEYINGVLDMMRTVHEQIAKESDFWQEGS